MANSNIPEGMVRLELTGLESASFFGRGKELIEIVDTKDDLIDILTPEDIKVWYKLDVIPG